MLVMCLDDEVEIVVWIEEMVEVWVIVWIVLCVGDEVGVCMVFKEVYVCFVDVVCG